MSPKSPAVTSDAASTAFNASFARTQLLRRFHANSKLLNARRRFERFCPPLQCKAHSLICSGVIPLCQKRSKTVDSQSQRSCATRFARGKISI